MNRELLEKPFEPEQIKQREGTYGSVLEYVPGHVIIQRLNDAFEGNWSFEILKHEVIEKDEVIVLGKLSAENVVKTQFGSSKITRAKETGEIVSLADDFKAAATDALKKTSTLLGVGLHLYNNGDGERQNSSHRRTSGNTRQYNIRRGGNGGSGQDPRSSEGNGRITAKQHDYILRLIAESGMTRRELDDHCIEVYGSAVGFISRADASTLISELLNG